MHPHILEQGKKVLRGRVYENVVTRDDLQDKTKLPIYRNKQVDYMQFTLSPVEVANDQVRYSGVWF